VEEKEVKLLARPIDAKISKEKLLMVIFEVK